MKKLAANPFIFAILAVPLTVVGQTPTQVAQPDTAKISYELSEHEKELLNLRIKLILEKDQQFRSYLSYGTTDETEIAKIEKLDMPGMLQAMSENKSKLPDDVEKLLRQLQRKNDGENYKEFVEIVKKYGYPSPDRLGVKEDRLFVLLLHPPLEKNEIENHTREFGELLLPEVKAGRMEAKFYAMFVDNMRAKILRRPQLYGTNQAFDRATGKILPPQIEDLATSNQARREIGMPELVEGEYRLVASKK